MRTIKDIAEAAKISTATVDRVLNKRPGVREATRRRVLETAAMMGYAHTSAQMAGLDFLLPATPSTFMARLATLLQKAGTDMAGAATAVRIHQIDYSQPEQVSRLLGRIRTETSGIGIVMLDHLLIREALKAAIEHGVPVLTLLSDISSLPHQGFIGVDNRLAGRLAGYLVGRLARAGGEVAVFTGSPGYRGHEEREMGFRHIMRTEFPTLRVLPTLETCEDAETAHRMMADTLRSNRDLRAVYAIGAGSEGIGQALDEQALDARASASRPIFVGHEMSNATRPFIISGVIDAVIDENPPALAERAVKRLIEAARHQMLGICAAQDVRIVTRENIPTDWS